MLDWRVRPTRTGPADWPDADRPDAEWPDAPQGRKTEPTVEADRAAITEADEARDDDVSEAQRLPAQPNNSLITGIQCLQHLVSAGGPIGSREVARRLGLTHTRVNRLLGTLAYMGLLERDAERRYRPGPGLHALAAQSMMASGLLPAALPMMKQLRSDGYTVALGTVWDGQVCYLFHERPGQSIEEAILRHELWPADHSTIGVALLAARGEPLPEMPSPPRDARVTLLPGQDIQTTVAEARKRGYAALKFENDVVSIGVTIGRPPVAGLAISSRHIGDEFIPEIAKRLHKAAAEIDARIHAPAG